MDAKLAGDVPPQNREIDTRWTSLAWANNLESSGNQAWGHLRLWEELGLIELSNPDTRASVSFVAARPEASSLVLTPDLLSDRVMESEARWKAMAGYISTDGCRAQALEQWFEDNPGEPCGICDVCSPNPAPTKKQILAWVGHGISTLRAQATHPIGPSRFCPRIIGMDEGRR